MERRRSVLRDLSRIKGRGHIKQDTLFMACVSHFSRSFHRFNLNYELWTWFANWRRFSAVDTAGLIGSHFHDYNKKNAFFNGQASLTFRCFTGSSFSSSSHSAESAKAENRKQLRLYHQRDQIPLTYTVKNVSRPVGRICMLKVVHTLFSIYTIFISICSTVPSCKRKKLTSLEALCTAKKFLGNFVW